MFVFYYAVLSEVSPPTALAAVAASAITGGDTNKTMMRPAKYTLPRSWCRSRSCSRRTARGCWARGRHRLVL